MTTIEVPLDELEEIAFRSGETLHMGGPFPVCHVKGTTYWARVDDVTIPSQRDAGAES